MSSRKLDRIIFLDLEATCWNNPQERGEQPSEIIEIGACMLNVQTGEVDRKTSYLVRPKFSTISKYCTELTSITPELIKSEGIPFTDAVNKLKKEFGPATRTWASWGYYDKAELESECQRHGIPYPMGRNHINANNLYA